MGDQTRVVAVSETTQAGEARRTAVALADYGGFSETNASNVAIVVTELATNLVRHGGGGEILLTISGDEAATAMDVLALDRGAGMRDPDLCLRDGHSTRGTAGTGLGAVRRLSHEFDLHSEPNKGSVIFARIYRDAAPAAAALQYAGVQVAFKGEAECGDAWSLACDQGRVTFLVADGLGHGSFAADASRAAVRIFQEGAADAPADLLERMHLALRSTRGAAAGVARVDLDSGDVRFCGVGNTCFVLAGGERPQHMISHNGTLGHQARRFQEFTYRWKYGTVLVMHSDGVSASWDVGHYPGLLRRHPGVIAGVLYRDFRRTRDDVTVLVARMTDPHG